jgi:hypothetical protein
MLHWSASLVMWPRPGGCLENGPAPGGNVSAGGRLQRVIGLVETF